MVLNDFCIFEYIDFFVLFNKQILFYATI